MRLSVLEGGLWALMVGSSETFFVADAVHLSASATELALVVGLPLATGSLGSLGGLRLLRWLGRRRPLVASAAALQSLNLLAIAAWSYGQHLTPAVLIAHVCLHHIFSMCAGTLWSSWYGDLVPPRLRGRYFGRRNALVQASTLSAVVVAGLTLQWLQPAVTTAATTGRGFALLYLMAALFRMASAVLLSRSPEPAFSGLTTRRQTLRFFRTDRGRRAGRVLLLAGLFQLTTYVASPYFTPFMLRTLGFSWIELTAATVTMMLVKSVMLRQWGRVVDAHGPRPVYTLAALLAALVPVPWLAAGSLPLVLFAEGFSGFAWAGYELSFFAILLETSYRRSRPYVFATQSLFNGSGQLAGSLLGALVLSLSSGSFVTVFAASTGLRLIVAAIAPRALPEPFPELRVRRRAMMLRAIGFRPHGGLALRPIEQARTEPATISAATEGNTEAPSEESSGETAPQRASRPANKV
jgi:MFS family permease